ncbi:MAG: hypothetical protein ABSA49_02095 [Rhizomicrobium sp.]
MTINSLLRHARESFHAVSSVAARVPIDAVAVADIQHAAIVRFYSRAKTGHSCFPFGRPTFIGNVVPGQECRERSNRAYPAHDRAAIGEFGEISSVADLLAAVGAGYAPIRDYCHEQDYWVLGRHCVAGVDEFCRCGRSTAAAEEYPGT